MRERVRSARTASDPTAEAQSRKIQPLRECACTCSSAMHTAAPNAELDQP